MFADGDDNPGDDSALVITDFDQYIFQGSLLPEKWGYVPEGVYRAKFENDDFSLDILRKELESAGKA